MYGSIFPIYIFKSESKINENSIFFLSVLQLIYFSCSSRWESATGFPGGSDSKEPACNAGDPGLIPRSGGFPGEENGYPLQYSCLENHTKEDPGELHSIGSQRDATERLKHTMV